MIETLLGSGSPIWTAIPSSALAMQPPGAAARQTINGPFFQVPPLPAIPGPLSTGPLPVASPLTIPMSYPFAAAPSLIGAETMVGVTAPALLTAVAMRRGQPQGPTTDQEVEDFIYDTLDMLPGAADVEVRCEGGRITLTGSVQHKRLKRDVGEIAWAIPAVADVQNTLTIQSRRRSRTAREAEPAPTAVGRKQG